MRGRWSMALNGALGAVLALGLSAGGAHAADDAAGDAAAAAPKKILILGGTGFLGPAVAEAAQAHGHAVTLFNRGKREKYVGTVDHVEKLYGNRDPDKFAEEETNTGPKGLEQLKDRDWDAVVDTSGFVPRIVKASAELLGPHVKQYVFISTISVYKDNSTPGADETAELATIADATVEDMGKQFENYGPLKALCEQAAEKAMPGRVTNIRPGYIVGPRDTTDRFTYWPVRVARGGEVLVPGSANDPVQVIDVRDLAEFVVHCIETNTVGVYDATGPEKTLTVGRLMEACQRAAKASGATAEAKMTYVPYDWLATKGLPPGAMPILLPSSGETAGFHTRNVSKAVKAGLKFRSIDDTCAALLAWWPKALELRASVDKKLASEDEASGKKRNRPSPTDLRAGIPAEMEAKTLEEWHAASK